MESLYLIGIAVLALFAFVLAIVLFNFFGLWLRARIANAPVSLGKMIGMRLRKVPVGLIVDNRITAVKAGLDVRSDPLEAHYLAGGDVSHVVLALIAADKAGITLDFNRACAIDLATKGFKVSRKLATELREFSAMGAMPDIHAYFYHKDGTPVAQGGRP